MTPPAIPDRAHVTNRSARLKETAIPRPYVRETTGRRRNKRYVYGDYLAVIEQGTSEP